MTWCYLYMMNTHGANFAPSAQPRAKAARNQNFPTPFDPNKSLKTGHRARVMPADPKPIFTISSCTDNRRPARSPRKTRNRNSPAQFDPRKWLQTQTRPQDHAPRSQAGGPRHSPNSVHPCAPSPSQTSHLSPAAAKIRELPQPKVTVIVPTLAAGDALAECLRSLETQTYRDFDVIVVDNSATHQGGNAVATMVTTTSDRMRVITNPRNVGFGAAINQGYRAATGPYLAALNDDAVAEPEWLAKLVTCADGDPKAGMFASEVRLTESGKLDSAGMLIAADGTSRQRGHEEAPEGYADLTEALFPSGSAALYRRKMLDQIGAFDEDFFLYCEDTDLGLRARWTGWTCRYVPGAVVQHRYSHSAGRASLLKAYYVERNRLCTIVKNFPFSLLVRAPFATIARYFWHVVSLVEGKGKAAEFRGGAHPAWLPFLVLRAHASMLIRLPRLLKDRRRIFSSATLTTKEFCDLLERHAISVRKVASL